MKFEIFFYNSPCCCYKRCCQRVYGIRYEFVKFSICTEYCQIQFITATANNIAFGTGNS